MARASGEPLAMGRDQSGQRAVSAPVTRALFVFEGPIEMEPLGALDEGDARFQAVLGGPRAGKPAGGLGGAGVEGWLLERGVAATLRQGGATVTFLLGPFRGMEAAGPLIVLPEGRTSPIHTIPLPGARLRVALRSVDDTAGRRRFLRRRLADPALAGRRCGLRSDDREPRAVLAEPHEPGVLLALFVPSFDRLLLAQATLEPAPI